MNILELNSALDMRDLILQQKLTAEEVVTFYIDQISKMNQQLNAYVSINKDAQKQAQELDLLIKQGNKNFPLAGIPIGIKDMICTRGLPSTACSKILQNFIPPYDATLVTHLKKAGAIILGKLNQDEFAMGSSNETSVYGSVKNPWNLNYVAGGSSGGSAAAQAANLAMLTIGTDTGGSIRQPASYCGVVGVKPTYGRISRHGVIAYASSLDQAGPFANNVQDAALALQVMCGKDINDMTSSDEKIPDWLRNLSQNMQGKKIGLIQEFFSSELSSEVKNTIEYCIEQLKLAGAEVVEVSIPLTEFSIPVYYLIASSEASSNLSRYDGVRYGYRYPFENLSNLSIEQFYSKTRGAGFGAEVKRRIMMGTYCLSSGYFDAFYLKASKVRRLILEQYQNAFQKCDVILSPVTNGTAFRIGEKISDPMSMYLNDIFTTSTNLAGIPGMSIPIKVNENNLPIGVQLMAKHFNEQQMLDVAYFLESKAEMKGKRPYVTSRI